MSLEEMNPWLVDITVKFFFFLVICACVLVAKTIICTWLEKDGFFCCSEGAWELLGFSQILIWECHRYPTCLVSGIDKYTMPE